MKKVLHSLAAIGLMLGSSVAFAQEAQQPAAQAEDHGGGHEIHIAGEGETQHYPLLKPTEEKWSFAGPFGTYDRGQLQRGFKVYKEVCSQCHSLNLVAFRTLSDLGYSEAQVKALAAEYDIPEGDDTRKGLPTDHFPAPAAQDPPVPDLSLMAKARSVTRGFPTFVFDIFTQYAEGGPDYIHSLLTGYGKTPPHGVDVAAGTHYNPYFMNASALAMAPPLSADAAIEYDDGTPASVDQNARDVAAFLMWTAEPHLEARKRTGFGVMVFLVLFARKSKAPTSSCSTAPRSTCSRTAPRTSRCAS